MFLKINLKLFLKHWIRLHQKTTDFAKSYTPSSIKRNCAKIEQEGYTFVVQRKNDKTQNTSWRFTESWRDPGKKTDGSFDFLIRNERLNKANPSKPDVLDQEDDLAERASYRMDAPRVFDAVKARHGANIRIMGFVHQTIFKFANFF